jgi:hypothetical protein
MPTVCRGIRFYSYMFWDCDINQLLANVSALDVPIE